MTRPERDPQCTLFARNLPEDTKPHELKEIFEKYGTLKDVYLPRDYQTRKPRGIAYIEFEDRNCADEALDKLNGQKIQGIDLDIEFAKGKRRVPNDNHGRYDDRDRNRRDGDYYDRDNRSRRYDNDDGYNRRYDDYDNYRDRRYDDGYRSRRYDDYDRRERDYPRKRSYKDYDDDRSNRRDRSRSRDRNRFEDRQRRPDGNNNRNNNRGNGGRYFDMDSEKSPMKKSDMAPVEKRNSPKNNGDEGFMSLDSPAQDNRKSRSRSRASSPKSGNSSEHKSRDRSRSQSKESRSSSASGSPSSKKMKNDETDC